MAAPRPSRNTFVPEPRRESIRKSWHALNPFSKGALSSLPKLARPARYTRQDNIPSEDQGSTIPDYQAINNPNVHIRVPKKIATPIRVEAKVWFANERTWVAWLNLSILMGTLSIALFNAAKDDVALKFAYFYALVSVGTTVYAGLLYQRRITMIRRRYPGSFDALAGPVIISILLFIGILFNFLIRVRQLREKNLPIPGENLVSSLQTVLRLASPVSAS